MAQSPANTWGQIIGNVVETGVEPILRHVADEFGLFLDQIGDRAARPGRKISWYDRHDNKHDLDFVFERGGSEAAIGEPVGFIEVAWRRYTKHSKNKAQEIQGAVLPLAQTYEHNAPFLGAVIAGEFTAPALEQLRSSGFAVLHFDYESVLQAFASVGIDASTEETTHADEFAAKIDAWNSLTEAEREAVVVSLRREREADVQAFTEALRGTFGRLIDFIRVTPLYGTSIEFIDVAAALDYLDGAPHDPPSNQFVRFEVEVRYSNGDEVRGQFSDGNAAARFIRAIGVPFES